MSMTSASKEGITIDVLSITRNKEYSCDNCWRNDNCYLKPKMNEKPLIAKMVATEVVVSLTNATTDNFSMSSHDWELVDTEGYASAGQAVCDQHRPPRAVDENWDVSPGTKVKFVLVFPEMDEGMDILSLIYKGKKYIRIDMAEVSAELKELFKINDEIAMQSELSRDFQFGAIKNNLERLKADIFARFHNTLTAKEITQMDNRIMNSEFSIRTYLETASAYRRELLLEDFEKAMREYHEKIKDFKEKEQKDREIALKVDQLYELTPREFEEWTAELMIGLGYKNVALTPQTGDKGIDVICEKGEMKIGVQCKKFKGVVGTPLIQGFAGALQAAGIDKGIFITTGTFSVGAEVMVEELPIELVDKVLLRKLIETAKYNK